MQTAGAQKAGMHSVSTNMPCNVGHMKVPHCAKEVCDDAKEVCDGGDEDGNDDGHAAESEQRPRI